MSDLACHPAACGSAAPTDSTVRNIKTYTAVVMDNGYADMSKGITGKVILITEEYYGLDYVEKCL